MRELYGVDTADESSTADADESSTADEDEASTDNSSSGPAQIIPQNSESLWERKFFVAVKWAVSSVVEVLGGCGDVWMRREALERGAHWF